MSEKTKNHYEEILKIYQEQETEKRAVTPTIAYGENKITHLPPDKLTSFPNHPFELYTGEKFDDLVESIKACGVITPLLIRELKDDTYQILSGHNRNKAAQAIGLKTVPCLVLSDLTDDDALMIMLDSNKQREISEMKTSQQAHIYALEVEVNKRQGKRTDLIKNIERNLEFLSGNAGFGTLYHADTKSDTLSEIGDKYSVSRMTISRLIRIDTLVSDLKHRIDNNDFGILVGVELSYLTVPEQKLVNDLMAEYNCQLNTKKAHQLRELSQNHKFDRLTAVEVLEGRYNKIRAPVKQKLKAVTIKPKFLSKYYNTTISQDTITAEIETSIDIWQEIKGFYPNQSATFIKEKLLEVLEQQQK
ncbi:MAG: ParB/RepB/Spo0J family partition protein [Clostridia bacterium]|nr:ParB/RepB/Spo0J family partition protein [Clostridia bacterium]MCI9085272.1 ParB/RepB/Spo0J family partition protein [Clostridia bacterium]